MANKEGLKRDTLFRKEVIEHKKSGFLGKVIIASPISFSIWSIGISCVTASIVLFLCFATYTKKHEVIGRLVPENGLINVYPKKPGIVIEKFVKHNDVIKKGDLLYLISTEQEGISGEGIAEKQVKILKQQIDIQKERISSFKRRLKDYKYLLRQKMTTQDTYRKLEDEYLNSNIALQDFEQKLNQMTSEESYAIHATNDGTISSLVAQVGDRVMPEKLVSSIIPSNSKLQGELFIPSSAIGFIKEGQRVLIKYQAYPYQNFGLHESIIDVIDDSILSPEDINLNIGIREPFYRAKVNLKNQYVTAYGSKHPLIPGMLLDVVILGEKRTLLGWILNPIYSLRGSLAS